MDGNFDRVFRIVNETSIFSSMLFKIYHVLIDLEWF